MGNCRSKNNSAQLDISHKNSDHSVRNEFMNINASATRSRSYILRKRVDSTRRRLRNIYAAPIHVESGFVAPKFEKNETEEKFIRKAVDDGFMFSSLSPDEITCLVDAFEAMSIPSGAMIIKQGEVGDYFYLIESGSVDFYKNDINVGDAGKGQTFGELALLYKCPRNATCIATEICKIWRLGQDTFRRMLASNAMGMGQDIRKLLKKVNIFKEVQDVYLNKIADAATIETFKTREKMLIKGEIGNYLYVIMDGRVCITDIEAGTTNYNDVEIGPGDVLGERALINDERRAANAIAITDVVAICISREIFLTNIGDLRDVIEKSRDILRLRGIPSFYGSDAKTNEFNSLSAMIEDKKFKANEVLFYENEPVAGALYIVRSGCVVIMSERGQDNRNITSGGYFGEESLFPKNGNTSKYTATIKVDAIIGVLTARDISFVMKDVSRLYHPNNIHRKTLSNINSSTLCKDIELEDLKHHRLIGVGTFGKVWLVTATYDDEKTFETQAYALKVQRKLELIDAEAVDGVTREKNILASLDHPFIINLVASFQDKKNVYFLLDLIQGGELLSIMSQSHGGTLTEKAAKFYSACILEGLNAMHICDILYRDLKPENVLINKDGYPIIVDLGLAKVVTDKTYTFCGTPLFLAPEVILGRGYDKGCDHWSWAILTFEMMTGYTPFYIRGIDQITLFQRIVKGDLKIYEYLNLSAEATDLMQRVLVTTPTKRLGSLAAGIKGLVNHNWFSDINFYSLVQKMEKPPFVPKIKNALDVDAFHYWDLGKESCVDGRELSETEQNMFNAFL